jgi:hypothetical protein
LVVMGGAASPDEVSIRPAGGVGALRMVVLGGVLGVPVALVAAVFLAVVHWAEHWLWTDLPHDLGTKAPPWYLLIGCRWWGRRSSSWPGECCRATAAARRFRD